jgi:hypothetical protein
MLQTCLRLCLGCTLSERACFFLPVGCGVCCAGFLFFKTGIRSCSLNHQNHKSIASLWFPMVPYQSSPSWKYNRYISNEHVPRLASSHFCSCFRGPVVVRPEETRTRAEHWATGLAACVEVRLGMCWGGCNWHVWLGFCTSPRKNIVLLG